ncbi:MAG: inositol monophosphatase family protein [Kiritimatiellia bacterium]|jgi:histidinol phosphatase-like enzyme (inositol monophosphatase family)|nr:inositol monophosphatase family protein [Kiritimatiellia bacterium]MDP6629836.1 inositol monophosphatase family protein [Kiritimatiellia bacterium]MDP6809741.1 inositol monophosphatase family protein [Kiritimatiellia bacterium]MDP7025149.1 inositol monophosphatase family protein [Kiritimatiellia bacterium]
MDYTQEMNVALELAGKAGVIQMAAQQHALDVERKEDDSPVTAVDRACEDLILNGLRETFPEDGFLGEETGARDGTSGRRWIVDPIDGTRPFIRGIPTYACLIGLEADGEQVVGVICLPALRETYYASLGAGAFLNDQPIRVSDTCELNRATGSALGAVERRNEPVGETLQATMSEWDYSYGFMDSYSYGCVAAGRLDLCVNILDQPWDRAAAACIVSEAGGTYSDIAGNRTIYSDSIIFSNSLLHDAILSRLQNPL